MNDYLKLAKAIKKGATYRPQCTGDYFTYISNTNSYGSCALGAAVEGLIGRPFADKEIEKALTLYGNLEIDPFYEVLLSKEIDVLVTRDDLDNNILMWMANLNDNEGWSREKIAEELKRIGKTTLLTTT